MGLLHFTILAHQTRPHQTSYPTRYQIPLCPRLLGLQLEPCSLIKESLTITRGNPRGYQTVGRDKSMIIYLCAISTTYISYFGVDYTKEQPVY